MNREITSDELRRLEGEVVAAERRLAEHEFILTRMKQDDRDLNRLANELESLREQQRRRQQDRLRLLTLLQK